MRCGHAADASLAPTEPRQCAAAAVTSSAECPGSKRAYAAFGQLGACPDTWVTPSTLMRRRSRAMPIAQHENEEADEADVGDSRDHRRRRARRPSGERPDEQA